MYMNSKASITAILVLVVLLISGCQKKVKDTPSKMRFNHVYLTVTDMKRSVDFYTTAFDLEVTQKINKIKRTPEGRKTEEYDINLTLLRFPEQNFLLEIGEKVEYSVDNSGANFTHLGVDVKDIEKSSERLVDAGAIWLQPITTVEAGDIIAKNAFFTGPDGETIELMQIIAGQF